MSLAEHEDQKALSQALDAMGLLHCHVPNAAKRSFKLAAMLKAAGLKRGMPDTLIFDPTRDGHVGMAIELKVGKNTPTREQKDWLAKLEKRGWLCVWGQLWEVLPQVKEAYGK